MAQKCLSDAIIGILAGGPLRDLQANPTLDPMARLVQGGHHMVSGSILMFGAGAVAGIVGTSQDVFKSIPVIGGLSDEAANVFKGVASYCFSQSV